MKLICSQITIDGCNIVSVLSLSLILSEILSCFMPCVFLQFFGHYIQHLKKNRLRHITESMNESNDRLMKGKMIFAAPGNVKQINKNSF